MKFLHPAATVAAVVLLGLATGGCCTPGQFGRADSRRGMDVTLATFGRHNRDDWERTREHVSAIPGLFASSVFEEAAENICATCRLYFTGSTTNK